jgi:hypothetical protein
MIVRSIVSRRFGARNLGSSHRRGTGGGKVDERQLIAQLVSDAGR